MKKVTVEKLKQIKPGEPVTFDVIPPQTIESIQTLAYRTYRINPERGIKLRTEPDWKAKTIKVIAYHVEPENE